MLLTMVFTWNIYVSHIMVWCACALGTWNTAFQATGAIAEQIKKDFGSYDEFKKQFDTAGNTAFGLCSPPEPPPLAP
jgi:superoxide dismutase